MHNLRVDNNCVGCSFRITKTIKFCRRNTAGAIVIRQPVENNICQSSVFANKNKDWRAWFTILLPLGKLSLPQSGEHPDGSMRPLENCFGFGAGMLTAPFGGSEPTGLKNP